SNGDTGDLLVLKYDAAGNKLYSTEYGSEEDDQVSGVALDSTGNSFVGGSTTGTLKPRAMGGAFIVRFDATGKAY
ncbi:MAG TPA: SBBP repeat-containing protein, partial [Polyangiaceae bacterium]